MIDNKITFAAAAALTLAACKGGDDTSGPTPPATSTAHVAEMRPMRLQNAAPTGMKATPLPPASLPAPPDVAKPPADAVRTPSGLASKVLQKGTGATRPGPNDSVQVNYTGWTTDGKMFDSSVTHGKPITFGVGQVIPGWTEGLQLMVEGEKRRLWIPAKLAYGDHPRMGAPAGDLTFDVELLKINEAPKPPPDVKAPPKDAKKTKSGLAYKMLKKGTGTKHPAATDRVTVHYSGWTTDGKMFDSSVARGSPTTFALNQVIKGWTEGVQLMTEGEKMRFWIPADLAYGEHPMGGRPGGTLVFDIELLSIH